MSTTVERTGSAARRRSALRAAFTFGLGAGAAGVGLAGCGAAGPLPPTPQAGSAPPSDVLFVIPRGT
ncbi:MAG TPA: hypothetical protein VFN74_18785, partial [Chloroflexota bacterium]|nr:hypothetical protein [Chloroflexota bacterium]